MSSRRGQAAADRAQAAADRAKQAGQRAADLRSRHQSLATGQASTAWTSESARAAHQHAVLLASQARDSAMAAYIRAADAHRTAATGAQARGDLTRAQEHRDLADADDRSAAALGQSPN